LNDHARTHHPTTADFRRRAALASPSTSSNAKRYPRALWRLSRARSTPGARDFTPPWGGRDRSAQRGRERVPSSRGKACARTAQNPGRRNFIRVEHANCEHFT
jgi:hypothetical protein